ncbi:putative diguanylate cyclase YdaM [compost metagenome]
MADSPSPNGTPMTISLGVAHCPDSGSVESSLKQADRALYAAKHQGRNRVVTAGAL